MDILEAIATRRSVREFTGMPVTDEQLEPVLRAGFQAPSAHNKQPWHFVIMREPATLAAFAEFHPYAKMLPSAGCGVVVCGDQKLEGEAGFITEDCSAAIQNMLLAAHGVGLGAVWCAIYPVSRLVKRAAALLELPGEIVPVGLVVVGNKAGERPAADRYRADRIHIGRW